MTLDEMKAVVLEKYPKATCYEWGNRYFDLHLPFVICEFPSVMSICISEFQNTEEEAWRDACERIEREKK